MTRPRRRLRTRLLVAMMAIALGVLVLTAVVTAGLARRSEANTARHDVQERADVVAPEFDQLIRQLPEAQAATGTVAGRRQVRRIRDLVNTTLRASNGAVVAVDANGDVQEALGRLLGTAGATPTLPDGVTVDDLDTKALLAGSTQNGRDGNTVFVAEPLAPVGAVTPVLVLAEDVNTRALRRQRPGGARRRRHRARHRRVRGRLPGPPHDPPARGDGDHRPLASPGATCRRASTPPTSTTTSWPSLAQRDQRDGRRPRRRPRARARVPPQRVARPAHTAHLDPRLRRSDRRRHRRGQRRPHPCRRRDLVGVPPARTARRRPARPRPARRATSSRCIRRRSTPARSCATRSRRSVLRQPSSASTLDVDTGDVVPVVADAQRLAQIVANLVENALKFATTRVEVGVRGRRRSRRAARRRRRAGHRTGRSPARLRTPLHVADRPRTHRWAPASASRSCASSRWRWAATRRVEPIDRVGTRFVVTFPSAVS